MRALLAPVGAVLLLCAAAPAWCSLLREGKGRAEVAPGATTRQMCDRLAGLEVKFRKQLDAFEAEWVKVSQEYETKICEGLGCEPEEHVRMQNKIDWVQIEERFAARKDYLMKMLIQIEKAIKTPPMRRCENFAARLEEEKLIARGKKALTEGPAKSVAEGEEAAPEEPKDGGATAEADDEPEDSMETKPPEEHLSGSPFPSHSLEDFGPETNVEVPEKMGPEAAYTCDHSVNFIEQTPYSQISLTDDCHGKSNCNWAGNPKYGGENSIDAAILYCEEQCCIRSGCTGFFFQIWKNTHEICGFYGGCENGGCGAPPRDKGRGPKGTRNFVHDQTGAICDKIAEC